MPNEETVEIVGLTESIKKVQELATENILLIMKEFEFGPHEFAKFTEIPVSTVYKYVEGTMNVSFANIIRVGRAFNIALSRMVLFDGSINDVIEKIKRDRNMMNKIEERRTERK